MMRAFSRLYAAAPYLLRHLGSYAALAAEDVRAAGGHWRRRAVAMVVGLLSGALAVLLTCLVIVAATWDTHYRVVAIGVMALIFVAIAGSCLFLARSAGQRSHASLARLRRAWAEDRTILKKLMDGWTDGNVDR